jgi:hypothetical protein
MDNAYNLNPQIFPPSKEIKPRDHHKLITGALVAALAMAIIGGVYWWQARERVVPIVPEENYRTAIISSPLNQTPTSQASPEEINRIINGSSAKPHTEASPEEKAAIINTSN